VKTDRIHVIFAAIALVIAGNLGWTIGQHNVPLPTTCGATIGTCAGIYFSLVHLHSAWQRAKATEANH